MSVLRRLLGYARPYAGRLLLGFLIGLVVVAFELARPWPIKIVIDSAIGGAPLPGPLEAARSSFPGAETSNGLIVWSVLTLAVIAVGSAVLAIVAVRITLAASFKMVASLAGEVFGRLQRLSLSYHQRHPVGDLLQRSASDIFVAQLLVTAVVIPALVGLLTLGGMFFIMARVDFTLSVLAMSVIPLQALAFVAFARPIDRATNDQWSEQGNTMSLIEQILGAIKAVQAFGREAYFQRHVAAEADRLGKAYLKSAYIGTAYEQVVTVITGLGIAAVLGFGAVRVQNGDITVGDLVVFIAYLSAIYGPLRELVQSVGLGVQVGARARRVFEILDSTEEIPESDDAITTGRLIGIVQFDHVTFGYEPGREPVLRDISLTADPGEVIALVGMSGAGKTSLVSLLSRFTDPWEGRVLIDGLDVRDMTLLSLRSNVALVLQDPFLLPVSIADNISFGMDDVDRGRIEAAARAARAHEFIERLPTGYDTVIGERGTTLSGGERQRIAIARALLADAPILVLDEPTSALDAITERQIFDAIEAAVAGRTTFIISHRLSTIARADRIITIEHGGVAEVGTHASLLAAGGPYAALYKEQTSDARVTGDD